MNPKKKPLLGLGILIRLCLAMVLVPTGLNAQEGSPEAVLPYEQSWTPTPESEIDRLVGEEQGRHGIERANPCSEEVFLRRVYLDITGTLPPPQAYWKYRKVPVKQRRAGLIDALLETEAYADYWTLKWSDLLRIKAEFPINLWPNGVQAYHRWIKESIRSNKPFDEFARELLTSSGSNFRIPPVNFYRAMEGQKPETIASAVSLTLMGVRYDSWTEKQQADLAHIFSRVAFKKTDEWKEEIVYLDPEQYESIELTFPDEESAVVPAGADPRKAFAAWLIHPDNPWFARNAVNRAWFWLMGRGLIHEPDDIREDNPCVAPALLSYLEEEFVDSGYDIKHVFRLILNSRTYQQSPIPRSEHPLAESLFSHYIVRRMDAEVLFDALTVLGGQGELYQSPVPEPFTFVPEYKRTVQLSDGSITSQFLEKFGRPGRDTGLEMERNNAYSVDQGMYMLNSGEIQKRITSSFRLRNIIRQGKQDPQKAVDQLYTLILARKPTAEEQATALDYQGVSTGKQIAYQDLCWALINSKEFLYRH
jgi:hypothetical protein